METITLDNGSQINIFDDVFPLSVRTIIYAKCMNAKFQIGWEDFGLLDRGQYDYHLHSRIPDDTVSELNIFQYLQRNDDIMNIIGGLRLQGTYVNLTFPTEGYTVHTDMAAKTLLYYVNPEWMPEWAGETMFWNDDLSKITYTSPYVPGRLVIFDSGNPHSLRAQSILGPKFRFSLAMFMIPQEAQNGSS